MNKYSPQLIYDYIMGYEIPNYDLNKLENDYEFMKTVIDVTNDRKMYNLCSLELKNNPEFVKFLINKFYGYVRFITMVAKNYLINMPKKDFQNELEIKILLCKYTVGISDPFLLECRHFIESFYVKKCTMYNKCIKDLARKDLCGMGFFIALEEYNDSELLKNFFACRMLGDIFRVRKDFDLEKALHDTFKDKSELIKIGINNFLLIYIAEFDYYLSNYVAIHINLIANLKRSVICYLNDDRWNQYESDKEKRIVETIINEILEFFKGCHDGIRDYNSLIMHIANEFNLVELFTKYDYYFRYYIEHREDEIEYGYVDTLDVKNLPFKSCIKLMNLKSKINEILDDDMSCNFKSVIKKDYIKKYCMSNSKFNK